MGIERFLSKALDASSLLQAYVGIAIEQLEKLDENQLSSLLELIAATEPRGPEEAGALAMLAHITREIIQVQGEERGDQV